MQSASGQAELSPLELQEFSPVAGESGSSTFAAFNNAELAMSIRWGRTYLRPKEVNEMDGNAIVPLDQLAREPVDVFVDGHLVARGEVLVHERRFAVRITQLMRLNG